MTRMLQRQVRTIRPGEPTWRPVEDTPQPWMQELIAKRQDAPALPPTYTGTSRLRQKINRKRRQEAEA